MRPAGQQRISTFFGTPLLLAGMWTGILMLPVHAQGEASSPAVSFVSSAKGNIFTADNGELTLRVSGNEAVKDGVVTISDEHGRVIGEQKPVADGMIIPLQGKGYYRLRADMTFTSGKTARAETSAAVVGPLLDDNVRSRSRIGLWTVQGDRDLVVAAGARWNRAMTSLGNYEPEFVSQERVTGAQPGKLPMDLSGFSYVGNLSFGLPLWLLDPVPNEEHKGSSKPFRAPKDWNALKDLVKAFVRKHPQWSEFPSHFEIYNEPEWHWKGSNEDLVRFEKTVAEAIKEVRPDVKVLGPGFSSIRIKDPARLDLETVDRLGLFNQLDGVVVHAYVDGSAPEDLFVRRVQELKDFLARIGRPDFPIHLTEFGWCTEPGTWQRPVNELLQARYAARSLALLAALGAENATYFCLLFKAAPNKGEQSFSIIHNDLTPKPAYASFANVARWLAGVQGNGRWLKLTPSTHLLVFRRSNDTIAVVWDTEGERSIDLADAVVRAEDMMGRPIQLSGKSAISISPDPVFLQLKDAGLYEAKAMEPLHLMRGNTVSVPSSPEANWRVPSPLRLQADMLEAPQDATQGSYLMLAKSGAGWAILPVEVAAPLDMSQVALKWPLSDDVPSMVATVNSHAADALDTIASAKADNVRRSFSEPVRIPPRESREIAVPLEDYVPGKRYRGVFTVESRQNGRRDALESPFDVTVLSAFPAGKAQSPDWSAIRAIDFTGWDPFGGESGAEDCSATFKAAYSDRALHLQIRVRDDEHLQASGPEMLWTQDSIQLGFDVDAEKTWEPNDLFGLKGHRVFEYGVAWNGSKPMNWRWISYTPELPVGQSEPRLDVRVRRDGDTTEYNLAFPWETLGLKQAPKAGTAVGIALAVTDADSGDRGRRGVRLFGGITDGKDPEKFGKLWLR